MKRKREARVVEKFEQFEKFEKCEAKDKKQKNVQIMKELTKELRIEVWKNVNLNLNLNLQTQPLGDLLLCETLMTQYLCYYFLTPRKVQSVDALLKWLHTCKVNHEEEKHYFFGRLWSHLNATEKNHALQLSKQRLIDHLSLCQCFSEAIFTSDKRSIFFHLRSILEHEDELVLTRRGHNPHAVMCFHGSVYVGHVYLYEYLYERGSSSSSIYMRGIRSSVQNILMRMVGQGVSNVAKYLLDGVKESVKSIYLEQLKERASIKESIKVIAEAPHGPMPHI
jgi:hypothetical protein